MNFPPKTPTQSHTHTHISTHDLEDRDWEGWKPINQWQAQRRRLVMGMDGWWAMEKPSCGRGGDEKVQGRNPIWCRHKYANHVIHNVWLARPQLRGSRSHCRGDNLNAQPIVCTLSTTGLRQSRNSISLLANYQISHAWNPKLYQHKKEKSKKKKNKRNGKLFPLPGKTGKVLGKERQEPWNRKANTKSPKRRMKFVISEFVAWLPNGITTNSNWVSAELKRFKMVEQQDSQMFADKIKYNAICQADVGQRWRVDKQELMCA